MSDESKRLLTEYGDFINKRGCFSRDHIWIIASDPDLKAYRWHQKYTLPVTKVLGKLACLVLSKILGTGTAERKWKQVKAAMLGQRVNTTICKTTKKVLIYAQYQQARAQAQMYNRAAAGKLWKNEDCASMKMDEYFMLLEANEKTVAKCVYDNMYERHICRLFDIK